MVFIGVDLDQIDKMVPRRVKSAPGAIELNQHFGAETDLLDLECTYIIVSGEMPGNTTGSHVLVVRDPGQNKLKEVSGKMQH